MRTLLGIICLVLGHDPDTSHVWFEWADEKDVFCVYPYQQRLHRCRRCHRPVKYTPLQPQTLPTPAGLVSQPAGR
ncbi:MAG: hypothetical protein IT330_04270 [Anaerolineae bacterium]|nr:hypothetical protein [Anaerolineae bacterium]